MAMYTTSQEVVPWPALDAEAASHEKDEDGKDPTVCGC
jgi:hypothetical protein